MIQLTFAFYFAAPKSVGHSGKYSVDFMNLEKRINLLADLGDYCISTDPDWVTAQHRANAANGWFTPEFIGLAVRGIATHYLQKEKLRAWTDKHQLPDYPISPRTVGLTMAGNIPLVGFHDFLSI